MLITTLSTTPGGLTQALQRQHLTTRSGDMDAPVFRRTLYLRLPTGGSAEDIEVLGDARLRATFSRFDYNALTVSESSLRASLSSKSGGVLVTLDAPRRISEITLSVAKSAFGQILEIYRLDGNTPASEPSVSASRLMFIGVIEQNFPASSIASSVEGLVFDNASAGDSAPMMLSMGGSAVAGGEPALTGGGSTHRASGLHSEAGGTESFITMRNAADAEGASMTFAMVSGTGGGLGGTGGTVVDGPQNAIIAGDVAASTGPFSVDFTDRRFLLRLKNSSGASVSLAPGDIANISVRSFPSNPRLGLAFPDPESAGAADPDSALFFWRADGEIGNGKPVSAGAVDAGADLEKEFARGLKRIVSLLGDVASTEAVVPTLPDHLDVALVVESDAPCIFDPVVAAGLPALRIDYHLARESFPDGEEKRLLRFEPDRVTSHEVAVPIPANAELIAALVVLDLSVRAGGSGATSASALATPHAVRVDESRWAAQPVELGAATTVSSIAMGVAAVTRDCELIYELRTDSGGAPDGAVIASGTLTLDSAGQRRWALARLEQPVVVSTAKHWLVVGTTSGSAIWLAEEEISGIRMLRRAQDGRLEDPSRIDGLRTLHALLSAAGETSLDAPFRVSVGENTVELDEIADDKPEVDLTSAAAAYLALGSATSLPVRIEAAGPGSVTVYPPRIVYDL